MRRAFLSLALPALFVHASPAFAQSAPFSPTEVPAAVVADSTVPLTQTRVDSSTVGPSRDGLRAGVQTFRSTTRPDHVLVAPDRAGLGQARAMMIVGGAALIVGAVIGHTAGTLIMVGGAVVGLAGLYQYLQ